MHVANDYTCSLRCIICVNQNPLYLLHVREHLHYPFDDGARRNSAVEVERNGGRGLGRSRAGERGSAVDTFMSCALQVADSLLILLQHDVIAGAELRREGLRVPQNDIKHALLLQRIVRRRRGGSRRPPAVARRSSRIAGEDLQRDRRGWALPRPYSTRSCARSCSCVSSQMPLLPCKPICSPVGRIRFPPALRTGRRSWSRLVRFGSRSIRN